MKNELKIVGIQADLFWENPEQNRAYFEEKINSLAHAVDVVVVPEMFTSGFTMQPENVAEFMEGTTILWLKDMAKQHNLAICGSLVIKETVETPKNNNYYNRLVFVHPSGKIETYDKKHSFTLAGEHKVYIAGTKKLIVNYKGWKICPLICYDLRFPVWARNTENYDVLLYVANWPLKRIEAWNTLLKARAIENMSYVVGVNRVGVDANEHTYSGNSLLVDYLGNELSSLKNGEVGIITATLKKDLQNAAREKFGFLNDKDTFSLKDA